jgi:hypothetical protein
MGEVKAEFSGRLGSAYRHDADCCKRYNISAKDFSCHGSGDEDVFSEAQFSVLEASVRKLWLTGKVQMNECRDRVL